MLKQIQDAKEQGYSDEEILNYLHGSYSGLRTHIEEAVQEDYKADEILDYIGQVFPAEKLSKKNLKNLAIDQRPEITEAEESAKENRGFISSVQRGLGKGVTGIVTGFGDQFTPQDESIFEHFGSLLGETISDVPAFLAGGVAGGAAGGALGSAVPGIGTVAGGVVGSAAGAFSLPTLIKSAYQEYLDYSKGEKDLTFGEFLESAGRVGSQTAKSAVIGASVSQAAKLLPILKKLPGADKLLGTRVGKALEKPIAELTTLTGAQAVVEQEVPTLETIMDNAAVLAGFKITESAARGIRNKMIKTGKPMDDVTRKAKEFGEKKFNEEMSKEAEPLEKGRVKEPSKPKEEKHKPRESTKEALSLISKMTTEKPESKTISAKKTQKESKESNDLFNKVKSFVPDKLQQGIEKISEIKDKRTRENKFFDLTGKHIDKSRAEYLRSSLNWRDHFNEPVKMEDGTSRNLTNKELQDMLYYRQKTGNPNVKGDSFEAISKRLPKEAKHLVDEVIDKHFKAWVERYNDNPATSKKINPREGLQDIYLPGLWEEKGVSYKDAEIKAAEKMSKHPDKLLRKQFKKDGPFTNQKVFTTWNEAIKEGGLVPRYDNIKDVMLAHDEIMLRAEGSNVFVETLTNWEKQNGQKLIQRSTNKEEYQQAKKDGWVPFDDIFLRRHKAGVGKDGKPIWGTTTAPALVHPDAAPAFQGIFRKNAFKPEHKFWSFYDRAGNVLKTSRVSLSPFHYVALAESGIGGMGLDFFKGIKPLRGFFSENWWDNASKSLTDTDGLVHRAERGLQFEVPDAQTYKEGSKLIETALEYLPKIAKGTRAEAGLKRFNEGFMRYQKFLFNEYHPRLKIATYDYYVDLTTKKFLKEGKNLTPKALENIERSAADVVNNQFGGQIWEKMRFLNDPENLKWTRRFVGYPDWSTSAARQAADVFAQGVKGDLARRYWIKYVSGWLMGTSIAKFISGGFHNDEENDRISWSPRKGLNSLNEKDPTKWLSFPLADVDIKIAGMTFNPGRDESGKKLYAHFGKQALEIPRYVTDTVDALFSKSNPVIQASFKQLLSETPYQGDVFPVRGKYSGGQFKPWDGTRPGTAGRALSRGKEIVGEFIPFSVRGLNEKGLSTTIVTGMGAIPVAKGMSLRKAESYIYDALRRKDIKKLNKIVKVLKDNKYDDGQIRRTITRIRKEWLPNKFLTRLAKEEEEKK